jgi:hypothetical protein
MTNDNFCFYLQNRLIQTSQTGGQWYSNTSPFNIPWFILEKIFQHGPVPAKGQNSSIYRDNSKYIILCIHTSSFDMGLTLAVAQKLETHRCSYPNTHWQDF